MSLTAFRVGILVMALQAGLLAWYCGVGMGTDPAPIGLIATAERLPEPSYRAAIAPRRQPPGASPAPPQPSVPAPMPRAPEVTVEPPTLVTQVALIAGQLPGEPPEAEASVPTPSPRGAGSRWSDDRVVVRLSSVPHGAHVEVDGRPRGRTPVKLMVEPGRHTFELRLGGRRRVVRERISAASALCFSAARRGWDRVPCDDR